MNDTEELERLAIGFPANGQLFAISEAVVRVSPAVHPLYAHKRVEIDANWQLEVERNPKLYNGQLIFLRERALEEGRVLATGHCVPYSTHLWWRRQADRTGGFHVFSWAVPLSSDGALIAIRMGPSTANPGWVYCAAGSLEPVDIIDGQVDLEANMARELREETGLDLSAAKADVGAWGAFINNTLMMARFYHFPWTADEIIARVRTHMIHDHEQEIDDVIAIRSADPSAHRYAPFMLPLLEMTFGNS